MEVEHCCGAHDGWPLSSDRAPRRPTPAAVWGIELGSDPTRNSFEKNTTMLISKKNRREVYKYLFKGG